MSLSQLLRDLLASVTDVEAEIMARVWGDGYDNQQVDRTDLSSAISFNIPWLLKSLSAGAPVDDAEAIALAKDTGRRRAIQGVPLDALIRSYRTGQQVIEDRLIANADKGDAAELLGVIRELGRLLGELTDHAVEMYRTVEQEVTGHYDRLTTDLVAQIASGSYLSSEEVTRRARIVSADPSATYAAVVIGIPEREDPATHLLIQRHLLSRLGLPIRSRILVGTLQNRPLILVPTGAGGVETLSDQLARVLASDSLPSGLVLGLGAASSPLGEMYAAAQQARLAVEVAQRGRRKIGVVRYEDVAVDTLLVREPQTAELLASLLAPLEARPELLETLGAHFANGFSARATARELYVHPNTVSHRLRTIERELGRPVNDALGCVDLILALRWRSLGGRAEFVRPDGTPGE
ncbi:PucR family transcriptional regulator [Gordonia sp. DT30]|uniref:PucR family transcriptional regulator n=1 Tax=unclassified Gordonia (in: high G+C Gram-positive bacteria) TaxID=2657482 RepID=UPI003CF02CB8